MKGNKQQTTAYIIILIVMLSSYIHAADYWKAPFDTTDSNIESIDSVLSLDDILNLVAAQNSMFKSYFYKIQSAKNNLEQVGLRPNPELGIEIEEFGWDALGFKESELTVSIAQEFDFFGQRNARKKVGRAQIDATEINVKLAVFELYLETKKRFFTLAHAQQKVMLAQKSVELAKEIVESINLRREKGAALQSELILAQLEEQRTQLTLDQAKQDVIVTEASLAYLLKRKSSGVRALVDTEFNFFELLERISLISDYVDSTREIILMKSELNILQAEKALVIAESRPMVTFSGGFKRFESNNSKSYLFGVSLPLPFFNRNQGTRKSIDAQQLSLEYNIEQSKIEAIANFKSRTLQLENQIERHAILDSMLLPTTDKAYRILQNAYEAGRVPFTQLLEAERALNDINFEHNDMLLLIQEQIIALESLTGVALHVTKEN